MTKDEIRELFAQHGVKLTKDDVWSVQSTPVVKHSALERLSAALGLTWDAPQAIISTMQDVVILARATRKDGISEWSYGECSIVREGVVGGNYKVSGKQAAYPWAMAEKRAKDRVIIKLAGLHGAYSSDESDDFNDASKRDNEDGTPKRQAANDEVQGDREESRPAPRSNTRRAPQPRQDERPTEGTALADGQEDGRPVDPVQENGDGGQQPQGDGEQGGTAEKEPPKARIMRRIDEAETVNAVTDLMLDDRVIKALDDLGITDEIREYAKKRLTALGWPGSKKTQARPRSASA